MTSLALSFNDVNFSPIQRNNQIWLSASELAKALGYAKSDAISQVYERNQDEFNSSMTTTISVKSNDSVETLNLSASNKTRNLIRTVRIFSLRGCHLIAMFSKTAIAKQFRKWVLDVLDKEVGTPIAKTHKSERTALHEAHALLVTKTKHLNSSQAWKLIHQRFNVNDVADIPYDAIPVAVEYVHHLIALYSNASKPHPSESVAYQNNLQGLAIHMIWVYKWWKEFGDSIRVLSPRMAGAVHDHFIDGMCFAGHFIDKQTRLAIDERTKYSPWHLNYAEQSVMDYRNQ